MYDDGAAQNDLVDERLLILAKKLGAKLCTTDYNLNKVARVESIAVLNINELAHALRPMYLPGERMQVSIVQPGQNEGQGVGYLDDGAMVVVDHAKQMIGSTIEVEVVRMLQTEAGRMLFARLLRRPQQDRPQRSKQPVQSKVQQPQPRQQPARPSGRSRGAPRRQNNSKEDDLINLVNNHQ